MKTGLIISCLLLAACGQSQSVSSAVEGQEDGHALWLRMTPNSQDAQVTLSLSYDGCGTVEPSPTVELAAGELRRYWHGAPVEMALDGGPMHCAQGDDGFTIVRKPEGGLLLQAHGRDVGLLYGAYHLLRQQETGQPINPVEEHPAFALRLLNHWDNLDGSIERGYAGNSIFWGRDDLPNDTVLLEYARANASIGINGTVLNNVNASPMMLSTERLQTVKHIADMLRPYGIPATSRSR